MVNEYTYYYHFDDGPHTVTYDSKNNAYHVSFNDEWSAFTPSQEDLDKGFGLWTEDGQLICVILPRQDAIHNTGKQAVVDQAALCRWLQKVFVNTDRGGAKKILGRFKYIILGARKSFLTGGGIRHDDVPLETDLFQSTCMRGRDIGKEITVNAATVLKTMDNQAKDVFNVLVPPIERRNFDTAVKVVEVKIKDILLPSKAFSQQSESPAHKDKDECYSLLKVLLGDPLEQHLNWLNNAEAVQFFMFPAHSLAIPLLPNSYMLFNPTVPHCVSRVVPKFMEKEVFLCSWFLSADVVGGHDNNRETTPIQKSVLKELGLNVSLLKTITRSNGKK
jgi:hypothetical protein